LLTVILTSAGVIGGIAVVLGLILALADKFLADYGEVTLTLNEDKELTVRGGNSLLYTLFQQKYFVPSACGGKGTCGYCKLVVTEGTGPYLPTEKIVLTDEEVAGNVRLSCQVKVRGDMRVQIPAEYFEIGEYEAVLERGELVTPAIKELTFRLSDPPQIKFKAGQYVQIQAPDPDTGEAVYRAYSMSSLPSLRETVSFNVRLEEGGIASTYLHGLKEGDRVKFSGPYGEFLYSRTGRNAVCLATGVGLAPFRSLIPDMLSSDPNVEVFLFFGARVKGDLYGQTDIEEWEKNPRFHYVPVLSAEEEKDWGGEWGRMDHVFFDKFFDDHAEDEYYLCGAPVVVNSLTAQLVERGVPEGRIHFDKFG
jgi:Na+-transporting NADH:ubiquinone oxidoreductase subunit F